MGSRFVIEVGAVVWEGEEALSSILKEILLIDCDEIGLFVLVQSKVLFSIAY